MIQKGNRERKNNIILYSKSGMAGVLIALAVTVYLSAENKYIGSALFTSALFVICANNYKLFTGAVGFALLNKKCLKELLMIFVYNCIFTAIVALTAGFINPYVQLSAEILIDTKLNIPYKVMFIKGLLCGICMYLAVRNNVTGEKNSFIRFAPIFMFVPLFILCGFEHSIADIGYMAAAGGNLALNFIPRLLIVTLGNATGAIVVHGLDILASKKL